MVQMSAFAWCTGANDNHLTLDRYARMRLAFSGAG
jgi:hypothetical protein